MRINLDTTLLDRKMTIGDVVEAYNKQGVVFKDECHDFGWALKWMKRGAMLSRPSWNGKDMCIFLINGRTIEYNQFQSFKNNACQAFNPPEDIVIRDHIDMKAVDGTYITGWIPSMEDMLADDWVMVDVK